MVWLFRAEDVKPPHFHGQLELQFVRRGRAQLLIGNNVYELRPRFLACILPPLTHFLLEFSSDLDMSIVHVEPEFVQRLYAADEMPLDASPYRGWLLDLALARGGHPATELTADEFEVLDDRARVARDQQRHGPPQGIEALVRAGLDVARSERSIVDLPLVLHAACRLAEETNVSQLDLCQELDVSPSYVTRVLKKELGTGFAEHRSRIRVASFLAHARQDANLLRAGLAAGFGSYSQLHRTFAQVTGWKPRDYVMHDGRAQTARIAL